MILRPHRCKTCRSCDHEEGSTVQSLWHWGTSRRDWTFGSSIKSSKDLKESVHVAGRWVIWIYGGEAICIEFSLMSFLTNGPQHSSACFANMSANWRIDSRMASSLRFWLNAVDTRLRFLQIPHEWISVKYDEICDSAIFCLMQKTGHWA